MTNSYSSGQSTWPTVYSGFILEPLPGESPVEVAERRTAEAERLLSCALILPDPCARRTADAQLASAQAALKALRSRRALQIPTR
jgi:hypothetical protein